MAKRIDLTGKKFGRWTVLGYDHTKAYGRSYVPYWKCKCECGKIKIVGKPDLTGGGSLSCGCLRRDLFRLDKGQAAFNRMYTAYKTRSEQIGREFTLSEDQFRKITQQNCHYCGSKPANIGSKSRNMYGRYIHNGIDRVDNSKGYTLENSVACCNRCNKMKSNLSIEEFLVHIDRIYKNLSK